MSKSSYVIAIDRWFKSEEGKGCTEGRAEGQYLHNRLWKAFVAGMKAAREIDGTKPSHPRRPVA